MICELCFYRCDLSEGQTGFCRARTCREAETQAVFGKKIQDEEFWKLYKRA